MGGTQVLFGQSGLFSRWRNRRMVPIYLEYFTSVAWAYTMFAVMVLWLLGFFVALPAGWRVDTLLPGWNGMVIGTTCLLQFAVSMFLDSKYEKGLGRYYYWMIWYPLAYWILNVFTTIVSVPKVILRGRQRATWVSPDRGIQP